MSLEQRERDAIHELILRTVSASKDNLVADVGDDDDVFAKFGLNSMETFGVLVKFEKTLDIVIGEEPAEFDRIRTLSGLRSLLVEKAREVGTSLVEGAGGS